jgi:hypothetical protein
MSGHDEMIGHTEQGLGQVPVADVHAGHGATTFEASDAHAGIVIWSLIIIAGTLVFVFAISIGIQRFLYNANPVGDLPSPLAPERVIPPSPQLEVHPWDELPALRGREEEILKGTGRDAAGRLHVPIERAMDAVIPSLHVRPNAPTGTTSPGGEGREFGGSQSTNRTPYRIEIKAEAEKRAK